MKDLKHTPAPWTVTPMKNVSAGYGKLICATQSNMPDEETDANIKLIASAPELLDALIKIHDKITEPDFNIDDIDEVIKISFKALNNHIEK